MLWKWNCSDVEMELQCARNVISVLWLWIVVRWKLNCIAVEIKLQCGGNRIAVQW